MVFVRAFFWIILKLNKSEFMYFLYMNKLGSIFE